MYWSERKEKRQNIFGELKLAYVFWSGKKSSWRLLGLWWMNPVVVQNWVLCIASCGVQKVCVVGPIKDDFYRLRFFFLWTSQLHRFSVVLEENKNSWTWVLRFDILRTFFPRDVLMYQSIYRKLSPQSLYWTPCAKTYAIFYSQQRRNTRSGRARMPIPRVLTAKYIFFFLGKKGDRWGHKQRWHA